MSKISECEVKNKYDIKVYIGNYNKEEFYSVMGKFFAERCYRKVLPYLINDVDKIWYLIYDKKEFLGFFGIKVCAENTLISDIYIKDCENQMDIFKYMAEYLVNTYQEEQVKVLTKLNKEQAIWKQLGFKMCGTRGNYSIMIRGKNI